MMCDIYLSHLSETIYREFSQVSVLF